MGFDRRMLVLLVALAVLGLPAFTLRVLCVGHSCDEPVKPAAGVPFCSLPKEIRSGIAAGFREGRSPDILGVATASSTVGGGDAFTRKHPQPQWPSTRSIDRRVPLVFAGDGISPAELPSGIGLDDVAPTIAALMGIERPHPEVRTGEAIASVTAPEPVPLAVQIVWKGIGAADLAGDPEAWPELTALSESAAATMEARVPSLPLDPAATLTTIGTGGLPSQHAITGSLVRNDQGRVVEAWGPGAPVSVIAALGDDLDEATGQGGRVGAILSEASDRGVVGKDWYVATDRDDVRVTADARDVVRTVRGLLTDGYGDDEVPDLLAVTLSGSMADMDRTTGAIADLVRSEVPSAILVVTATGSPVKFADLRGKEVAQQVDALLSTDDSVVEAVAPGGLYLDQRVLTDEQVREDEVLEALEQVTDTASTEVFADTFSAIAVSFGRYC